MSAQERKDGPEDSLMLDPNDPRQRWHSRLVRLSHFAELQQPIAPALRFYRTILEFQAEVAARRLRVIEQDIPLRAQIEVSALSGEMPSLFALVDRHGPELLREAARQWELSGEQQWCQALESVLDQEHTPSAGADDFFTRACLQPIAENLQLQLPADTYTGSSVCPACGGRPQMAVLRPEGDAAGRWLLCSFCLREWPFRRLICPWCGQEDKQQLPRFSSPDWPSLHLEACDGCRRYLKAIDMTVDGFAVPLIDEAAWSVLDVWAADRGYSKIMPNLMGF
jgi:FdhE protein